LFVRPRKVAFVTLLLIELNATGWCAGNNVFPSLMHAGMQLSVVGVGLPGLRGLTGGCMSLCGARCCSGRIPKKMWGLGGVHEKGSG